VYAQSPTGRTPERILTQGDEKKVYLRAPLYPELKGDIEFPKITNEGEEFSDDVSGIWIG
jgi:hypothetical protein